MEISLWVTNKCNLQCKYCYVDQNKGEQTFDIANVKAFVGFVMDCLSAKDEPTINFFGGEPLLGFQVIQEVIRCMEEVQVQGVNYRFTTNGLLLDKQIIDFIKEKRISVSLSWDGSEKVNNFNRLDFGGNGTFDGIFEKYRLLRDRDVENLRIRATFNSETYKYLKESVAFFEELDPNMTVVFAADYFDKNWDENRLNELKSLITDLDSEHHPNITIIGDKLLANSRCGGGVTSCHVYTDGRIYPCSYVVNNESFCIGNIWKGLDTDKISDLSESYVKRINECKGCDYEQYCLSYKCKYLNYVLAGSLTKASPIVCMLENIKMCNNI